MEAITASLERSLQNCSLNNKLSGRSSEDDGLEESSATNDSAAVAAAGGSTSDDNNHNNSDAMLELNSHISLPYHWEQCLDLKTGEIYYINWRNGMKAKEDPRGGTIEERNCEDSSSSEEKESWLYDSEESSSESSSNDHKKKVEKENENNVLVVAGCKICLMYNMVPKHVHHCPKCNAQLLHFHPSLNSYP